MKKTIRIEGMSCGHCTARVKKALEGLTGVTSVEVDLSANIATIEADDTVTDDALKSAIDDAGYDVLTVE